jgi:hypothetical protein
MWRKFLVIGAGLLALGLTLKMAPVAGQAMSAERASILAANHHTARYLVLVVLDGGRPDYLNVSHLPHLEALRKQGVEYTQAMDGILESETPAGHTTLTTGSTPRRDGILGFNWAQNDNDFSLFSPTTIRAGALEQIMEDAHAPTLAGLYKARYPTAKVVALSGHKYYAADPLGGPHADAIMYYQTDSSGHYVPVAIPGHVPPAGVLTAPGLAFAGSHLGDGGEDKLVGRLALASFRIMRPRMELINEPEFDWPLGHVYGGNLDPRGVQVLMRGFDRDLGRIENAYRRAGILNQTLFVVTADHGMAPVKHFIPYTFFTGAVARAGTSAPSIAYNHSAYIWLRDPAKAEAVAENVVAGHNPYINSVYYLQTVGGPHFVRAPGTTLAPAADAANQYLLATLINGHEPNVVVFPEGDATTSSSATNWKADHGGPTWQSQHIPLIIAGPGIRAGATITRPAQLDDVAPTVLADMGVTPIGMEGHTLADALANPTAAEERARAAEIRQIGPVVRALERYEP